MSLGDIDDDGDLDVFVGFSDGAIAFFKNTGTASGPILGTPESGNFGLATGGTLGICDAAGIEATGNVGSVQLTGSRSFSNDASYIYNGTVAQVTGGALPSKVRNLSTTNANSVTLNGPETVMQALMEPTRATSC